MKNRKLKEKFKTNLIQEVAAIARFYSTLANTNNRNKNNSKPYESNSLRVFLISNQDCLLVELCNIIMGKFHLDPFNFALFTLRPHAFGKSSFRPIYQFLPVNFNSLSHDYIFTILFNRLILILNLP